MKRILAGLLSLAMLLNLAPVGAFAADPVLQPEQEQNLNEQNELDTAAVTLAAADSFGQLLLDSMDTQAADAGTYTGQIYSLALNSDRQSAAVHYAAPEEARLVVAAYTDESLEEMIASGSVTVEAGDGYIEQLALSAALPDSCILRAYLLAVKDAAPLSAPYAIKVQKDLHDDLKDTTADDFDQDRVIRMGSDPDTNFAVVTQDAVLRQESADANHVVQDDAQNQRYVVENADEVIRGLQQGEILVCTYGDGRMLVVKVKTLQVDGSTVTIQGDADMTLQEAFDTVKLEGSATVDQLQYTAGSADAGVTPEDPAENSLSTQSAEDQEEPFQRFQIKAGALQAAVGLALEVRTSVYVHAREIRVEVQTAGDVLVELDAQNAVDSRFKLGEYTLEPCTGLRAVVTPELVIRTADATQTSMGLRGVQGFRWDGSTFYDTAAEASAGSDKGYDTSTELELDLRTEVEALRMALNMTMDTQLHGTAEVSRNPQTDAHSCAECYDAALNAAYSGTAGVYMPLTGRDEQMTLESGTKYCGRTYYSKDHNESGGGLCPYSRTRLIVNAGTDAANCPVTIYYSNGPHNGEVALQDTLDASGVLEAYLSQGHYRVTVTVDGADFSANGILEDEPAEVQVTVIRNPDAESKNLTWYIDEEGSLTVRGTGRIPDYNGHGYENEPQAPWADRKDEIKKIYISGSITGIGANAFRGCTNAELVVLTDTVRTIGQSAFENCSSIYDMFGSTNLTEIGEDAFAGCTNLMSLIFPMGVKRIGAGAFRATGLSIVQVESRDLEIGNGAFENTTRERFGVTFPETMNRLVIGANAFRDSKLTSITLPEAETLTIGSNAFAYCRDLMIYAPESNRLHLSSVGENAFYEIGGIGRQGAVITVDSMAAGVFRGCSFYDAELVLGKGVTAVSAQEFEGCRGLVKVVLPDGLKTIPEGMFKNCSDLTTVTLPAGLTEIGDSAFAYCAELTDLTLPAGVTAIGMEAFRFCEKLTALNIPASVTKIGSNAFVDCKNIALHLENLAGITELGAQAFRNCTLSGEMVLSGGLSAVAESLMENAIGVESVTIHDGPTALGSKAFWMDGLQELTIPASVTKIGSQLVKSGGVFGRVNYTGTMAQWKQIDIDADNTGLTDADIVCTDGTIGGTVGEIVESGTVSGSSYTLSTRGILHFTNGRVPGRDGEDSIDWSGKNIRHLVVDGENISIEKEALKDCKELETVELRGPVEQIGTSAFENCTSLKQITFQSSVKSIYETAFKNCTALEEIDLPDGVNEIGNGAFAGCTSLRSITIPDRVKQLTGGVFAGCASLQKVHLPENIQLTGNVFANCTSLQSIRIPGSVSYSMFEGCTALEQVETPSGITEIGERAFAGCTKLTSLTLADTLTEIGSGAFEDCTGLESFAVPEGVTYLYAKTFAGCTGLVSVTLPSTLRYPLEEAFAGCTSLQSIVLPEGVDRIESKAFQNCTALTEVTIPSTVVDIQEDAFDGCTNLKTVHFGGTMQAWLGLAETEGADILADAEILCTNGTIHSMADASIEAGTFPTSGGRYELSKDGTLRIIGTSSTMVEASVDWSQKHIKKLIVDGIVQSIEAGAFKNCTELETAELRAKDGDSAIATFIRESAFENCTSLTSVDLPKGVSHLGAKAFAGCTALERVSFTTDMFIVEPGAFDGCTKLTDIDYDGTWERFSSYSSWEHTQPITVHCSDGDHILEATAEAENSVTSGTAAASNGKYQAAFANAEAGRDYVVIISRSASDPLTAANLLYINQITVDADGELSVPFITAADASEMAYVVACARDAEPVDPDQPDNPSDDHKPSTGGGGGGAGIILVGGVVAVAAVAGVVLMMPAQVEGTVKLAGQPVANAAVQVLKDGAVAAQTTTDANGHFALKVRRGSYTLRVQWTDAAGQLVTRTVDFKAPNANVNIAA